MTLTPEQAKFRDHTLAILDEVRKNHHPLGCNLIEFMNKFFWASGKAFNPEYFSGGEFFVENFPRARDEKERLLEVGCGIGNVAIMLFNRKGYNYSEIYATDINPGAVDLAQRNFVPHGLLHGNVLGPADLFDAVPKNEKFDTIYWNIPWNARGRSQPTSLEKSCFDPNFKSFRRFLSGVRNHLFANGRVIIGFSSSSGYQAEFESAVGDSGYTPILLAQKTEVIRNPKGGPGYNDLSLELYQLDRRRK